MLPVPDALVGQRADVALARMLGMSRASVAAMFNAGRVRVDGVEVDKSTRLTLSQWIEIEDDRRAAPSCPSVGMPLLFEDEDVVVVNKPVGVAAHTGPGWDGPSVIGSLEAAGVRVSTSGPAERKGIVHRLDVGTSGAMVVAKSELAYTKLKYAFKHRMVTKTYHALVCGHPDPASGTIDAPIGRHPSKEWRMAVVATGREAISHYCTLELAGSAALLEVRLETGRTHQIRVHCAAIGHPCVGDTFYGADQRQADQLELTHQWLHAAHLGFIHPRTKLPVEIDAPYPDDLARVLDYFRDADN